MTVITANSAQQIPHFTSKDHPNKYNPKYPQLMYKKKKKRKEKKRKKKNEEKLERSYRVRY